MTTPKSSELPARWREQSEEILKTTDDEWGLGYASGRYDSASELAASLAAHPVTLEPIEQALMVEGCSCECDHHWEEHDHDCPRCFACIIQCALNEVKSHWSPLPGATDPLVGEVARLRAEAQVDSDLFAEAAALLARAIKYAKEDRARTPGKTRLARVLEEAERFLQTQVRDVQSELTTLRSQVATLEAETNDLRNRNRYLHTQGQTLRAQLAATPDLSAMREWAERRLNDWNEKGREEFFEALAQVRASQPKAQALDLHEVESLIGEHFTELHRRDLGSFANKYESKIGRALLRVQERASQPKVVEP